MLLTDTSRAGCFFTGSVRGHERNGIQRGWVDSYYDVFSQKCVQPIRVMVPSHSEFNAKYCAETSENDPFS